MRPAAHLHIAQHHFRVVHKIGIHPNSIGIGGKVYPLRLNVNQPVALLEEDNVRCDLRAGSSLEGVVRQPDRTEKVRSLRDILSDIGVFLVQCTL